MKSHQLKMKLERAAIRKFGTADIERLLRWRFEEKGQSIATVAGVYKCSRRAVRWWVDKFGVSIQSDRFHPSMLKDHGFKGWHDFFMRNQGLTKAEMADMLGCHRMTVSRAYKKWIDGLKGSKT